jgi:ubiquinone biosynthesis protein Coq4
MGLKKSLLKLRAGLLVLLTHRIALPLLKRFRRPGSFSHTLEELREYPTGTLGKDLFEFLSKRNLPLLKHYARHDLKHVLLGFDTTEKGEVCLQSFMLGNRRISFPVLATVIYGFLTMPEYWREMRRSFLIGRDCNSFHGWDWNEKVAETTQSLRKKIFNNY